MTVLFSKHMYCAFNFTNVFPFLVQKQRQMKEYMRSPMTTLLKLQNIDVKILVQVNKFWFETKEVKYPQGLTDLKAC